MQGTQLYVPPLTKLNKIIIASVAVAFILQTVLQKVSGVQLAMLFGLTPNMFFSGYIYQLLTYPLVQTGLMGAIFDCLIIWFIGSELETNWGKKTYGLFLATSLIVAGLFYLVIAKVFFNGMSPLMGVTGLSYSLLLAYSILYPDRILTFMLIFPMKARYFCMLLIGILFFTGLLSNAVTSWGHLAAMFGGFGHMYWTTMSRANKDSMGIKFKRSASKKSKANLYIVKDGDDEQDKDKDPKYFQ